MKNITKIITLIIVIAGIKISGQIDTLNYLKNNFEINKNLYINKPFSLLLNDITQIQPTLALSNVVFKSRAYIYSTRFNFVDLEYSYNKAITLMIIWQEPIKRSDTKYFENLNHGKFTLYEKTFYGSKIIKDIKVYR